MKRLSLLLLLTLFTFGCRKELTNFKNTGYYFCYSHKGKPIEDSTINYILYTDIQKIPLDEQVIKEKAFEWGEFVKKQCKNANGCTSDLMYYNSAQEANAMMNELIELYKNPEKNKMEKLEFK